MRQASVTLNQALSIINSRKNEGGEKKPHYLACGFEPLHLKTFLRAQLLERLPGKDVEIQNGVYGDLPGNLAMAAASPAVGAAVVLEWSDIDPRLGVRSSGGWSEAVKPDILSNARQSCMHLETALEKLGSRMPAIVVPPSLPLPPVGSTTGVQASVMELELEQQMASFLARISVLPGVRIVQRSRLDRIPAAERLDAKMELLAGFPYTLPFCGSAGGFAGRSFCISLRFKRASLPILTIHSWSGIVGEVWDRRDLPGIRSIHTQIHGLYQQMLAHLASCRSALLAVCSKNLRTLHSRGGARPGRICF